MADLTPGKWHYEPTNYAVDYSVGQQPEPACVFAEHKPGHCIRLATLETPQEWISSAGRKDGLPGVLIRYGDVDANGQVMAAAKDLLAACEQFANMAEYRDVLIAMSIYLKPHEREALVASFYAARAAIAKAKGDQP